MARIIPKVSDRGAAASWSSGKEVVGTDRVHRGWFLDYGLTEPLDAAAQALGWPRGPLSHLDGDTREHWLVPMPCPLYILILGLPFMDMLTLARNDIAFSGLGCRWRWQNSETSRLGAFAIHPDLLRVGYTDPFPFLVSSTSTDDLLRALLKHNAVLNACEDAASAAGKPRPFEFWEVALPFGVGAKSSRGSGDKTSQISPIACAHPPPEQQNTTYLRSLLAPPPVRESIVHHWPTITAWAADIARHPRSTD